MNHADLVAFLRRAHAALREDDEDRQSYIFVKENCCDDGPGGIPQEFMDEEDSSLTRYVHVSFRYEIFGLRCFSVSFVFLVFLSFFCVFCSLSPPVVFESCHRVPFLRPTSSFHLIFHSSRDDTYNYLQKTKTEKCRS